MASLHQRIGGVLNGPRAFLLSLLAGLAGFFVGGPAVGLVVCAATILVCVLVFGVKLRSWGFY